MVTGEKPLSVITFYMERVKVSSPQMSWETRTLTRGALNVTRFDRLTEALTVSGTRKAKHSSR
jgi:hypothetical protein